MKEVFFISESGTLYVNMITKIVDYQWHNFIILIKIMPISCIKLNESSKINLSKKLCKLVIHFLSLPGNHTYIHFLLFSFSMFCSAPPQLGIRLIDIFLLLLRFHN